MTYSVEEYESMARTCGYEIEPLIRDKFNFGFHRVGEKDGEIWNPATNPGDCFRMQEAIVLKYGEASVDVDNGVWVFSCEDKTNLYFGEGETLQDAWCNLAIQIGASSER